jgi:polysaccharide chain length determinant protein (PEP-CTERM system associated)
MIQNRELTMDDYLAMLRRRLKVILIPTLLAPLLGFAVSFAFPPKYTSESLVMVEDQKVPEGYVKPVLSDDLSQRVTTLEQRALGADQLRPLIERLHLASGGNVDGVMDDIRKNVKITAVATAVIPSPGSRKSGAPGFNIDYSASSPREAQSVCSELTNLMIKENFTERAEVAKGTTEFLRRQVEEDKRNLQDMDGKLADFKKGHLGQLPTDSDTNIRMLMGMNSQLDATTQALNRAQQDKTYTESLLAQQLAAMKSTESSTDPKTLQKQLSDLQTQLLALKARYTDDYPDVVKTKRDIAAIQKKLDEANTAAKDPSAKDPSKVTDDTTSLSESPEIRQLRYQLHQYQTTIAQATREQQRIQDQIKLYQSRVATSPNIEEQYKELTRSYETEQKVYDTDLAKLRESEKQTAMEAEQQGEQMQVLRPASMPDAPSFPNRWLFAGGGLGAGLAIGFGLALWLELRDTAVRTEDDVVAAVELPVLTQVPWVGVDSTENNGKRKRKYAAQEEAVEV